MLCNRNGLRNMVSLYLEGLATFWDFATASEKRKMGVGRMAVLHEPEC
jgi:hypothetical protein